MGLADLHGLPHAVHALSASAHEITLVHKTLEQSLAREQPQRLIGERAYDSDVLDREMAERGIEMIAPHKSN